VLYSEVDVPGEKSESSEESADGVGTLLQIRLLLVFWSGMGFEGALLDKEFRFSVSIGDGDGEAEEEDVSPSNTRSMVLSVMIAFGVSERSKVG